jgi:hypothetical protein
MATLGDIDLFQDFPPEVLTQLEAQAQTRHLAVGTVLQPSGPS